MKLHRKIEHNEKEHNEKVCHAYKSLGSHIQGQGHCQV